ncbi:MAG TPA: D-glycerate dehydrogenase [Caulobacteraceae bacterium]|nr:D-glycerate dehydrogenase [Caulobacteraceae bacterium]
MARPKLLLSRHVPQAAEDRLAATYELTINPNDRPMTAAEWVQAMPLYDAICPNPSDRIDAATLATPGSKVRILANYGAGVEHIDLAAAKAAGIVVTNTPGAVTEPTADLAIMLMLMASRRASEGERQLRAGEWTGWRPRHMVGQSLSGKLLGLVGFGRIAQATAQRAKGFGMRLGYSSRNRASPEIEAEFDVTYFPTLNDLAVEADVLSLHTPGGPATRHLINAERLALMKPTAIVVNTSRGSVIDEDALAEALAGGKIAAAGLDVFEREPLVNPALLALENAVLLPHLGSATIEARTRMGMQAADNLDAFFSGAEPPDRVA